jgi:putative hydrolase of the HAD superfamily
MGLDAVIFDWGGTLTPWRTIDGAQLWSAVCEQHFPAPEAAAFAAALWAAESQLWRAALDSQRRATIAAVFELAGIVSSAALIASYLSAWEPHTFTDPDVPELLRHLRGRHQGRPAVQHDMAARVARRPEPSEAAPQTDEAC